MKWTEHHHAWIVSEYFRILTKQWGDRGLETFIQATRTYGEQRGKRMAMRAIKDGQPLNLESYFAYGEYSSTPEFFQVKMWADSSAVNEQVTQCPWADIFSRKNLKECGVVYCREIDKAIVRGFCPHLHLDTTSTQHYDSCCRFYFRQDEKIQPDILEKADNLTAERKDIRMPMDYHCAHVYHVFSATAKGVFGKEGEEVSALVLNRFEQEYGKEAADYLAKHANTAFDTIISLEEWEKIL